MRRVFLTFVGMISFLMASAQALPFTAANYSPAALAMGGASAVETSSIAYSAFRNAAAVPFAEQKMDVNAGFAMWAPSGVSTNVLSVAGAYNMNRKLGVTAGLAYGMNPAYDVIDASGSSKGQFKPTEMQLKAGVSYRFIPCLSAGVNVGYASAKLAEGASYGAFDADVFLMAKFGGFKAAAGVSDLGGGVTSASGAKFSLPSAATLGLGYEAAFGEKNALAVQADADYYLAGAFAAAVGASYTYDDMISVRAGYRAGAESVIPSFMSLGAGVEFAGVKLDLAYLLGVGDSYLGNTLAISVGYSF